MKMIGAELSYDEFHNKKMVKNEIYNMFKKRNAIRNVSKIYPTGRARNNKEHISKIKQWSFNCACDDFIVKPNGDIFLCGCENAKLLGNISGRNYKSVFKHIMDITENHEMTCQNESLFGNSTTLERYIK